MLSEQEVLSEYSAELLKVRNRRDPVRGTKFLLSLSLAIEWS